MKKRVAKLAIAVAASILGLLAASPAAACGRTLVVRFDPDVTQVADRDAIAAFLAIPVHGARQRIIVRVSGPDHDLARRRALALADMLQAHGLQASGIMIESNEAPGERAVLLVYPPRREAQAIAQAAPAPPTTCGG